MYKKLLKVCRFSFTKKGFTLTEMMTVAVILSILIAVVVGNFRNSLERARFQEGLQAAEIVSSAIERYYYDNPDLPRVNRVNPTFDQLDIELSGAQTCEGGKEENGTKPYCRKIKNFEIQIDGEKSFPSPQREIPVLVIAYRGTARTATREGESLYTLGVIPSFVKSLYTGDKDGLKHEIGLGGYCSSGTMLADTKAFQLCSAMGYAYKCSDLTLATEYSGPLCKK